MYINCKQHRTPFAVFACIFEVVVGYTPPSTGKHIDEVVRLAAKRLSERDAALLVCLDDANYLHESCPFSSAHQDGAFAIQFANGAIFAGCHHASCGGGAQRWPELRGLYEKKVRKSGGKAPREKEQEEKTTSPPPADEHRERALTILKTGDPLAFILDTFNKSHVGGRTVAECLAMSLASQSVESMGVEIFAVRQLQSALGLSYYQTRRLLNGYVSRGTLYSGLLEKCPAISLYDATVTENNEYGVTVRRREQYFTFDHEVYRAWGGGASVWLDNDRTSGSSAADVQHMYSNCCQQEIGRNEEDSGNEGQDPDIDRSLYVHVQQNERTESTGEDTASGDLGACVFRTAVHEPANPSHRGEKTDSGSNVAALIGSTCCTYAASAANINPADYIALPVKKDDPEPTSAGGGRYPPLNAAARRSTSATTASKRQNGQECNPSPGSSTTGRFRGRRSNSAGVISAARRERSTARGRGGRVSVISVTQGSSGNGTGGRG